ncbi:MAG: 7TM diverse intracellular signaling domain-containing protein [bacterium]|nr:7TM diverse intracellular signaling domain-containing protein [bacterium]
MLLLVLLGSGSIRAETLRLESLPDSLGLEPWVRYSCDGDTPRTLDAVRGQAFLPLQHPHIALGFRPDACWFHWSVENASAQPQDLLLTINYPVLDHVELYVLAGDILERNHEQRFHTGDSLPFHQRLINSRNFIFPQLLPPGSHREYFLRVESTSSMTVPLKFVSRNSFIGQQEIQEWSLGLFYGISTGLLLYHVFLWIALREKIYRFYVLHIGTSLLYLATLQGLAFRLWPEAVDWNNRANYMAGYTLMLTGVLFARDYLNTAHWKRGDRFLLAFVALLSLSFVAQLFLSIQTLNRALAASALLTMLVLFMTGIVRWRHGLLAARQFVLAWGLFLLMGSIFALKTYGFLSALPIPGVINVLQLGIVMQQALLSLGLASRLNTLKAEKLQREQDILRERTENEAKGDFLAKMSHEIRTPMNAVLGLTHLLQDSPLNTLQRRHVDLIDSAGQSLLDLINDILDYSRLNAGKLQLEHTVFNLHELLDECASMFRVSAEQKNLNFIFTLDSQVPEWVSGDPFRLRQVLNNLLSNAIKFTPHGEVELQAQGRGGKNTGHFILCVQVRDTGIGLRRQAISQLFQAFQQADVSTTRKYGGSGLGLAISRQLLEMMKGTIDVESTPGRGSCFRFTLPLEVSTAPAKNPATAIVSTVDLSHLKVLVVEDQPVNRIVIAGMLQRLGIHPLYGENGQEALDVLAQHPEIDLVLMDCEMPVMDGYEATRQLRRREAAERGAHRPVIALTAHAMPEHRERCLAAGMDDHLSKPLSLAALSGCLQRWNKSRL